MADRSMAAMDVSPRQSGFMKSRSTYDHLYTIESVMGMAHSYKFPLNGAFLDLEKAFDTVNHKLSQESTSG